MATPGDIIQCPRCKMNVRYDQTFAIGKKKITNICCEFCIDKPIKGDATPLRSMATLYRRFGLYDNTE